MTVAFGEYEDVLLLSKRTVSYVCGCASGVIENKCYSNNNHNI